MNEWMNDKGVCRTALATPGLLKIYNVEDLYICTKSEEKRNVLKYASK